jgi:hypothetical protein
MQDRILGPLTMLQFVYAVVGFGTCYAIYMSMPRPASYFLISPIALFVLCLDFVKINERPFLDFFISAIEYAATPKRRFWRQSLGSNLEIEVYHVEKSNESIIQHKNISPKEIDSFAHKSDSAAGSTLINK